jgi:signal peptidase I
MAGPYEQVALELSSARFREGDAFRLRVNGNSMSPALRPGDSLLAEVIPLAGYTPGDLVVIRRQADWVTHRLLKIEGTDWIVKGDNLPLPDPGVRSEDILGRVVAVERGTIRIDLQGPRWQRAKRRIARLSEWEARIFRLGMRIKTRLSGSQPRPWAQVLARGLALPFRLLQRFLIF